MSEQKVAGVEDSGSLSGRKWALMLIEVLTRWSVLLGRQERDVKVQYPVMPREVRLKLSFLLLVWEKHFEARDTWYVTLAYETGLKAGQEQFVGFYLKSILAYSSGSGASRQRVVSGVVNEEGESSAAQEYTFSEMKHCLNTVKTALYPEVWSK